jgi:hypothetical protein
MTGGFEAEALNTPHPRTADEADSWVFCPYDKVAARRAATAR